MSSSVIITTYRRPGYLLRAVKSVLNQTVSAEVVVVDDNGLGTPAQKETKEILKDILDRIVYLPLEENSGACTARNKGAAKARGEYLFFLDDDDEFLPEKVETQSSFLAENPGYDGCVAAFRRVDEKGNTIVSTSNFPSLGTVEQFVISGNVFTPMICIRKSSFIKIGGFKEIPRFQDKFFMIHALLLDMRFAVINIPLHIMYEHNENRITGIGIEKTKYSLSIINELLVTYPEIFSKKTLSEFEINRTRMIAVTSYVSCSYRDRLRGIMYWWKAFLMDKNVAHVIMILKSVIPANIFNKRS